MLEYFGEHYKEIAPMINYLKFLNNGKTNKRRIYRK